MSIQFTGGPLDGIENPPWMQDWDVSLAKPKFFWPISSQYMELLQEGGAAGMEATLSLHSEKPNYAVYELVRSERTYRHIGNLPYEAAQDAIDDQDNRLDLEDG